MNRITINFKYVGGIVVVAMAMGITGSGMANPSVTNVTAAQRGDGSGLVDVHYTLSGVESAAMVSLTFSNDDGMHWNVIPKAAYLSGDVGTGIGNGANHIWPVPKGAVFFRSNVDTYNTISDTDGFYAIELPPGIYEISWLRGKHRTKDGGIGIVG